MNSVFLSSQAQELKDPVLMVTNNQYQEMGT